MNKECSINIKIPVFLVAIATVLYGCETTKLPKTSIKPPPPSQIIVDDSPVKIINKSFEGKVVSDGSHLKSVPMSRDFVTDSKISEEIQANFKEKGSKGSEKIFSIKPTGMIQPRAVILLEKKIFRLDLDSRWKIKDFNAKVHRKNIDICQGFMKLTPTTVMQELGKKTDDALKAERNNHVITYMPAIGNNKRLPKNADDCDSFITKGYDYKNAEAELSFILGESERLGNSPYLVVYESPQSPYSSMILSLGNLSPHSITLLASEWPELIMKVYEHGDNIDPVAAVAYMLENDKALLRAEEENIAENIEIITQGGYCGIAAASSPVSLTVGVILALPACTKFIKDAAVATGYL